MTTIHKALIWAGIIIGTAAYSSYIGLSDAAATGMTMGMVGAAWASVSSGRGACRKGCA